MENIQNDPKHKGRADVIAADFAKKNLMRKAKVLRDDMNFIEGDHTPLAWRVDGDELIVVLNSGPKIRALLKGATVIQQAVKAVKEIFEDQQSADERQRILDAREEELNLREKQVNDAAARLETLQATTIDPADGISDEEASAAGKALQKHKK